VLRYNVVLGEAKSKYGYGAMQFIEVGRVWIVYGMRVVGVSEVRSSGGRIKVRIVLSALEVRREVPSADH